MGKSLRRLLAATGALLSIYLLVVLGAGISQLADVATARVSPAAGEVVFWGLTALFVVLIASPVVLYLRLPPALIPPETVGGPEHDEYLAAVRRRLASNPRLRGRNLSTDEELESALDLLSAEADRIVRETAGTVFIGTAIMQNGRLDGAVVLATQARMVWQIASVYYQRPSPRQMGYLYANVGVTALLATGIEEIDFSEIVAPLAVGVVPSLKGALPGLQAISALLVNSLSNGAANAFLTLRVGEVARQYCQATSLPSRSLVRRNATAAALTHLGRIVKEKGMIVTKATWNAVKGAASDSLGSAVRGTRDLGSRFSRKLRRRGAEDEPEPGEPSPDPLPGEPTSTG